MVFAEAESGLLYHMLRYLDDGDGPLVFGIDETLERRSGKRISARGIYRDSVRSSGSHFVKASGLRWISAKRWLPHRYLVVVADKYYSVLTLLHFCQSMPQPVTFVTRLRMDSSLFELAPPRPPRQNGRPRLVGRRLPKPGDLLHGPQTEWTTPALFGLFSLLTLAAHIHGADRFKPMRGQHGTASRCLRSPMP
jgi:hypothetical protein